MRFRFISRTQVCSTRPLAGGSILGIIMVVCFSATLHAQSLQKAYGTELYEAGTVVKVLADGSLLIGGNASNYQTDEFDLLLMHVDATGKLGWAQLFGTPEREVINDIVLTLDSGFLILAEKYLPKNVAGEFLLLLKTDRQGNLQWQKIHDDGGNETEGFSIQPTPDGNFIIAGMTRELSPAADAFYSQRNPQALYMLKVNQQGEKLWSRKLSVPEASLLGADMTLTRDGAFLVTGNIGRLNTHTEKDKEGASGNKGATLNMLAAKVDPNAGLLWVHEYQSLVAMMGLSVIEKREGGFLVAGNCFTDNANNADLFLISLDENGKVQWAKTYGGPDNESAGNVLQTPDKGFILYADTRSFGADFTDVLLIKTDNNGNIQWAKTYGTEDIDFASKAVLYGNEVIMTGEAGMGTESLDVLLFKADIAKGDAGCLGKTVQSIAVKNMAVTMKRVEQSTWEPVQPGKLPANIKRTEIGTLKPYNRTLREKNICNL
ncbi:MAG: hypothetical protein KatS3mg031_0236 [Chitinophagales bacterium]|nr:MAG: hypothetical protein KatS3mg031_0236 [Chitinophagales bacterium]